MFQRVVRVSAAIDGGSKSSCGNMDVHFSHEWDEGMTVSVTFGGYLIGGWSRGEKIGPFNDEHEAFDQAISKVDEALKTVREELTHEAAAQEPSDENTA